MSEPKMLFTTIEILDKNLIFGTGLNTWAIAYRTEKDIDDIAESWLHNDILQYILFSCGSLPIFMAIAYLIWVQTINGKRWIYILNHLRH